MGESNATGPFAAALMLAGLFSVSPAVAELPACSATRAQKFCGCDFTKLRPLQGAVGMGEVTYKASTIANDTEREYKALKKDPIKVVVGPDGQLFITDHHHGAKAWLQSGKLESQGQIAFCHVVNSEKGLPPAFKTEEQLWAAVEDKHLVHLENEKGIGIKTSELPRTLNALPDDPYRSLAWLVRVQKGFCKSTSEFAEFEWADWFRSKFPKLDPRELPSDPKKSSEPVSEAVKAAHSAEAKSLPGYSAADCKKKNAD